MRRLMRQQQRSWRRRLTTPSRCLAASRPSTSLPARRRLGGLGRCSLSPSRSRALSPSACTLGLQLVDAATVRAQLRISSAFNIFDHEHNNTVDARLGLGGQANKTTAVLVSQTVPSLPSHRELGTIVRALGCAPSETELNDIIVRVEEEDASGLIKYERFEPVMTEILLNQRHPTDSEETIRRAFAVLDKNKQGYLTQEDLSKALSGGGEPFSAEEIEEMMSAAVEPDRGLVYYDSHATIMALEMGADV